MRQIIVIMCCLIGIGNSAVSRDLDAPPLRIEGAQVSEQSAAKQIAIDAYRKKMRAQVLATGGAQEVSIITLGYDVPKFASQGQRVWEIRVMTIEQELRAIIWVNPQTKAVHFVRGAWGEEEKQQEGNASPLEPDRVEFTKGEISKLEKRKLLDWAREAEGKYREIREAVIAGNMQKVGQHVLDDGELLRDENAAPSPEFQKCVSLEQKIFKALADIENSPSRYRLRRTVDYAFTSTESAAGEIQKRVTVRFQFQLEGSKEVSQKLLKHHQGKRTVSDEGDLVVIMKKIGGQWYWTPFGW